MNLFPMHIWVVFWFLSMECMSHISLVSSAPVNPHNPSKKIIKRILDMDENVLNDTNSGYIPEKIDMEKQTMVPISKKTFSAMEHRNHSGIRIYLKNGGYWEDVKNTDMDMKETYSEPDQKSKDPSVEKKGINWDEVIHNRPLLAEVMSFGCLSLLFALTGGAALWLTIYTHLNREETRELDNLAEKLVPLQPLNNPDTSEQMEPAPKGTEKEREIKSVLHSVMKTERKKKRRKKRRSVSKLSLTRREMFGKENRRENLGVNTQDRKIPSLSKQIEELQKLLEKENNDGEKMQDAKGENQVQLLPNLPE